MKNKTKKILAVACMGIAGMGLMTGCSVKLSQEQVDKVMTVVDSSDKFMEETLDLLQESNKKLDRETAFGFYQYAVNRLKLNFNNVWDNLRIDFDWVGEETPVAGNIDLFKLSSGKNVMYYNYVQGDDEGICKAYHDSTEVAQPARSEEIEGGVTKYYPATGSFEYYAYQAVTGALLDIEPLTIDFDLQDIVDCQVLDNGNYLLIVNIDDVSSYISDEFAREFVGTFEISEDGHLKSVEYMYKTIRLMSIGGGQVVKTEDSKNYGFTHVKAEYNYNVLSEAEVQANIDARNE